MTDTHSNYLERDHNGPPLNKDYISFFGDDYSYYTVFQSVYPDQTEYIGIRRKLHPTLCRAKKPSNRRSRRVGEDSACHEVPPQVELLFEPGAIRMAARLILNLLDVLSLSEFERKELD